MVSKATRFQKISRTRSQDLQRIRLHAGSRAFKEPIILLAAQPVAEDSNCERALTVVSAFSAVLQFSLYGGRNAISLGNLRFRSSAVASRTFLSNHFRCALGSQSNTGICGAHSWWLHRANSHPRNRRRNILAGILFHLDRRALGAMGPRRILRSGWAGSFHLGN